MINEQNFIHPVFDWIQIHLTKRMNAYCIRMNMNTIDTKKQNRVFHIQLKQIIKFSPIFN